MHASDLPFPDEPHALKHMARTLLDQAPDAGLPLVVAGEWIAGPLWGSWRGTLEKRGMDRETFGHVVAGYGNEVRLWVVGERPWEHCVSGLAGRVARRLAPAATATARTAQDPWRAALDRVDVAPDDEMIRLVSRIGELHLLYDISPPVSRNGQAPAPNAAFAIVWAGGRPRDPEVPFGEGRSESAPAALAEALGRFLLKDPAYPPR
jgi:hypothetical protein